MAGHHIADDDLERYSLGTVTGEVELAQIEEHLLACASCLKRVEAVRTFVYTFRAALAKGEFPSQ